MNRVTHDRRDFLRIGAAAAAGTLATYYGLSSVQAASSLGPAPAGKLSVIVWGNQNDLKSQQAGIKKYLKENPQVTIDLRLGGACGVDQAACKPLIAAGTMPDVFVPGIWDYNSMVNQGILTDFTPLIQQSKFALGNFNPRVINQLRALRDGRLYGLPMGYNMQGFFYNKDMFDKAGLAYPNPAGNYTWDDVRSWAKKLTLDANGNNASSPTFNPRGVKQWGFTIIPNSAQTEALLLSFGGSTMVPPAYQKSNLENPNTIKAWQFLQDMMYRDKTTITPALDQEQAGFLRWSSGHVAMQVGSHEQVGNVQAQNPKLRYDYVALPKGPAGNASCLQIHIWSIYNKSKNKDLAWHLVQYLSTTASGKFMGLIPAYTPKLEGDFLKASGEPQHLYQAQILPSTWKLTQIPTYDNQNQAQISGQDGYGPAIQDILTNKKSAADALKGLSAKINALMQQ